MTTLELQGISHELAFWKDFVKTKRFIYGWLGRIPTPELNDIVKQFIHYNAPKNAKVLDVGSGVVSILNGLRHDLDIIAADPLGGLYQLIFEYGFHRINPPLPVPAEEITDTNAFDIVHCSNALDHTQLPGKAFNRMREAVKPGGYLIIQGFTNEAVNENWQGFHQWNIDISNDGTLTIEGKTDFKKDISIPATTWHKMILPTGKEWFIYILKKD